jgi:F0F1-type ATP synthase assembly protein I
MKQTTAPQTPSPTKQAAKPVAKVEPNKNPRTEFLAAAMNMSWQLAAIVLVPIIGGFELDKKLHTLPVLTIAGFFVAMAGMALVVWHQLQLFSPPPVQHHRGSRS